MSMPVQYYPCECHSNKCHSSTSSSSRPERSHRYGTFVVLRPDAESSGILSEIAKVIQTVLKEKGLFDFVPTSSANFHITIASPLKSLDVSERDNLMKKIAGVTSLGEVTFELKIDTRGNGGNHYFSFGGSDDNPYVILRILPAPGILGETKNNKDNRERTNRFARGVRCFCVEHRDGALKLFSLYVTLGRFSGNSGHGKEVHKMERHVDRTSGMKSLSEIVRDTWQDSNDPSMTLKFKQLELLQVDEMKGFTHRGHETIASVDLTTRELRKFDIPPCWHRTPSNSANWQASSTPTRPSFRSSSEKVRKMEKNIPSAASYFCPISQEHHALDRFKKISVGKKFLTIVLTVFATIASLPILGLGGIATFRALTRHFSVIEPVQPDPRLPASNESGSTRFS